MVSLARTDAKLNSARAAAPDNVQQPLLVFCTKIRPGHLAVSGALKTDAVFSLRQDPCKGRSYAAGGARYLHADLMLLTHAGCAFKDPRGRFGISNTLPGAVRGPRRARE